jgi:dual specificity phosphatase 12
MSAVDGEGGKGKRSGSNSGGAGSGGVMKRLSLRGVGWGLGEFLPMSALDTEDDDDGDEGEEQEASDADTTSAEAAEILGRRMSDAVIASPLDAPVDANGTTNGCPPQSQGRGLGQPAYASPADLAAQLYTNPKLAGLRGGGGSVLGAWPMMGLVTGPILANPKCSGYFLEPVSGCFVSLLGSGCRYLPLLSRS